MDRDELIFREYKLYAEQKENFTDRNFRTNRFYMISIFITFFALIFTGNVVFMDRISATLLFSVVGVFICTLWWMNVDSYNILIKIKFANVLEKLEERLPEKPFTEESKAIADFRNNKVFMFSDIQKLIAVIGALFFFVILVSEITPLVMSLGSKIVNLLGMVKGGI